MPARRRSYANHSAAALGLNWATSGLAPAVFIEGTEEGLDAAIRMVNIHGLVQPPADRIQFDWLKIPDRDGLAFAVCCFVCHASSPCFREYGVVKPPYS
jgi:hypothetical protein